MVFSELNRVLKTGGKIISDVSTNMSQFALDGMKTGNHTYINLGRKKDQEEIYCFCPDNKEVLGNIFSRYFMLTDVGRSTSKIMNNSTHEFIYCGIKTKATD